MPEPTNGSGVSAEAPGTWEGRVPLFFVSHASGDDDVYVQEFFEDLCAETGAIAGIGRRADVGILGSDAGTTPEAWPERLAAGLAGCQVFVALCTPRLLLNVGTGRQLWLFRDRLRRLAETTGHEAPALLPLRWAAVPSVLTELPDFLPVDPAEPDRPLRQYLRLRALRPRYREFVSRLAGLIVRTAREHPLPRYWPLPVPARTPSALSPEDDGVRRGSAARKVRFVVAAGSHDDMATIRDAVDFYGRDAAAWAPYRPVLNRPLADHARSIAAGRLFGSQVTDLKDLPATLSAARRANELVVLLLDAWSTRIATSRRILTDADEHGMAGAAVLVPLNTDDVETERNREELLFEVEQTLAHFLDRPNALFHGGLPTPHSFDAGLSHALEEGRNRILKSGPSQPTPAGAEPGDRPILSGP